MIAQNQRVMRNGWMIPFSLEWLFWPIGYKAPPPVTFVAQESEVVDFTAFIPATIQRSLAGRYKITNRAAWMKILTKLGVVKEEKTNAS